ncbi:hypothetical protein FNV43_RR20368 [Rhamnella rubrinervis]|uniref:Leucine-rich repeat-containing N-terminal plant-type domain-containing protein n=1 Tax=Rhamnella rubrinervis TaxID=2594499 RepID=A0A8K0DUA0_9ROSA|nr:hypothetical protein FNV43_RR20368 [Rhamnella rubrinervis]
MDFSFSPFIFILITACFSFSCSAAAADDHAQPLCHSQERIGLLKFKESFVIDNSSDAFASNSKFTSWTQVDQDCCSWDGVECDEETGHVIELDLSSCFLYGSINSTSTLFQLSQLQKLNLAYNNFSYSQIPSAFGNLSRLTYLNLSHSYFYGQIPLEISQLYKLSSLDLSLNAVDDVVDSSSDDFIRPLLELKSPSLSRLLRNLTNLEQLYLDYVDISSTVPVFLANFTSLRSIFLRDCGLFGEFPETIFRLPNLQSISLRDNKDLTGYFPEFHYRSPLESLVLRGTSYSGNISTTSIENLDSLSYLDLGACKFSGLIPRTIGKLSKLTYLDLKKNNFEGQIPYSLQNLTQLTKLELSGNQLIGHIPPWLANLTQLTHLSLSENNFHGNVPESFSRPVNLEILELCCNALSGTLDFDNMFLHMKHLFALELSENKLSLLMPTSETSKIPNVTTTPKFGHLGLSSCYNSFTGFELDLPRKSFVLPWVGLGILDISGNLLEGSLPVPPPSIIIYESRDNKFSGKIPAMFCNLISLQYLDLINNKLSGELPQCLKNLSGSLFVLNLRNNHLQGSIPEIWTNESQLKMIDLSHNRFQGRLPRSLHSCSKLQVLNIGNNELEDVFPSWLGTLQDLRVLGLRSKHLHGVIGKPFSDSGFPHLQVIDLSYNNFTGTLPCEYFQVWNSMKHIDVAANSSYLKSISRFKNAAFHYEYSIIITIKGMDRVFEQIQDVFAMIDFSSNKFEGEIPECIGSLQGLHVLSLSNNILTGSMPPALGNILQLESLDLSQNRLFGEIPHQLMQLNFLAFFNVSHNPNLTGPIPQGNQFGTFDSSSYDGNFGLCGNPLPRKCGNSESPKPPTSEKKDSKSSIEFHWITILPGYAGGLVVGIVIGYTLITYEHVYWLMKIFRLRQLNARSGRR